MTQLAGIEKVVQNSESVSINHSKIGAIARHISSRGQIHWLEKCPVDLSGLDDKEKTAFFMVFNAISFSYWGEPTWNAGYNRGTWSMINSLKIALDRGMPVLEPGYLANLRKEDLEKILRGTTRIRIPLFEQRLDILRELGQSIRSYGNFIAFIENADHDALELVKKLVSEMPSFEDFSEYSGERIEFNKRAQLLASDIGNLLGFKNLDKLTACADYILPMMLRYHEVLAYSPELAHKVDNRIEIARDSEEEIEIRANTIWAVELIKKETCLTAMQVNDTLWLSGDSIPEDKQLYHLTRTTKY